ncbi:DoxX family protein [Actinocorallia populi]|uniref:DoxX family protein n=1 Tax=Actinocorallia populi TaxID=2079200 RepID=UPI000D097CFC|nr:DoxX family protein [Actinocorallia populi]
MFTTLLLFAIPALGFGLLGVLGVRRFTDPRVCAAHGMAVMLLFTGLAHFLPESVTAMPGHDDMAAMVPSYVPFPRFMVYATGVLEFLGALGLVLARTRPAAGACLALLFVLMFPANVHAAAEGIPLNGDPATPLWFRLPEQLLFIAVALWASGIARRSRSTAPAPVS